MLKHSAKTFLILLSLFACTACFDMQETVLFRKDGSGKFSFVVDLEHMKSMMALFEAAPQGIESNELEVKDLSSNKISNTFWEIKKKLSLTPGINQVNAIEDTARVRYGIEFNFSSIAALNNAMNDLFENDSAHTIAYFQMSNNQLVRHESMSSLAMIGKYGKVKSKSDTLQDSRPVLSLDKLFADVTYSTSYEFEHRIAGSQNTAAVLSPGSKSISLRCYPFVTQRDTTQNKCTIANTILFK